MGAAQDSRLLPESQHARNLRCVKRLEEVKAGVILLEHSLTDQAGSE